MRHAILDDNGVVTILFLDAPTADAIEVPDFVTPGYKRIDGEFVAPPVDLDRARTRSIGDINMVALRKRGRTVGVAYSQKREEALEVSNMFDQGEQPDELSDADKRQMFPLLFASVGIEADSLTEAAQLILKRYTESANRDGDIEKARLIGRTCVKNATSLADIKAASADAIKALEDIDDDASGLAESSRSADE